MMRTFLNKIHKVAVVITFTAAAMAVPSRAEVRVLATIKPVHALASGVMLGAGAPELLIGGAASVHSYSFKPSDARKIANATLIFEIGPDLETYLNAPIKNLSHGKVVALAMATGVVRLPAREGGLWQHEADHHAPYDPHLWLDPQNAIAMTRAIAAALKAADPARGTLYTNNADRQIAALTRLDQDIKKQILPVKNRRYIVFHDAYQYFERRYGLAPSGSVAVAPDRPVGPQRLSVLRQTIRDGGAICLFREPQFPPKLIDTLTEGRAIRVGVLDPLGADIPPGAALYPTLLRQLAQSLSKCLQP